MKRYAKLLVAAVLGWQVRRLRAKHDFRVIAVAGSIGKTSTKFAIASVLKQKYNVRFQEGNYNDLVSVPLVFFGLNMPNLFNPMAWAGTFLKIEQKLRAPYEPQIVIVELGTNGPGDMRQFQKYLHADIGVLTAIAPEHMEFFHDIDRVAWEELEIVALCDELFVNNDLVHEKYLAQLDEQPYTYGQHFHARYRLADVHFSEDEASFVIKHGDKTVLSAKHAAVAEAQLYSVTAAVAVGHHLGIDENYLKGGVAGNKPVSGRMQRLKGINDSVIIDDTYNASPEATKAALDTLYRLKAPQKIALLGNMNELGKYSKAAHIEIGEYCDPKQIDLLVTIGPHANKYLAEAAKKRGCEVMTVSSPYAAGKEISLRLKPKAVILAKGSQNGVFAEEALKELLANRRDERLLVRQTPAWLKTKRRQFSYTTH